MLAWLTMVVQVAFAGLNSRRNLLLENLALRHQLLVLSRTNKRPRLTSLDRALWAWLSQSWGDWKIRLCFVQPSTVIQWHRSGFRLFWRWKSRPRKPGRQTICPNTIDLIRQMSHANPLWGARSGANVWITSLCSTRLTSTVCSRPISRIITRAEPTGP